MADACLERTRPARAQRPWLRVCDCLRYDRLGNHCTCSRPEGKTPFPPTSYKYTGSFGETRQGLFRLPIVARSHKSSYRKALKALPVIPKNPGQDCQSLGVLGTVRTRCRRSADRIEVLALPGVRPGRGGTRHAILNGHKSFFQARRYRTRRLTREPARQRSKDREAPRNACQPSAIGLLPLFAPHCLDSSLPQELFFPPVHDRHLAPAEFKTF